MAAVNDTQEMWTCVDTSGTRFDPKQTESAGTIQGGVSGYFTTHRKEVAQELAERYPHQMLITHHERQHAGRATRSFTWTVPEMPWKREAKNGKGQEMDTESRAEITRGAAKEESGEGGNVHDGIRASAQERQGQDGTAGAPSPDVRQDA